MNFVDAMENKVAWKLTENGMDALKTTFDSCLDLFATIGALRTRSDIDIADKFSKAYRESPLTAVKILFYARDIEEGLGERRVFKTCLKWLANFEPEDVKLNLENIVKFGRWDDLYVLVDTKVEKYAFELIKKQWREDCQNILEHKPVSLLAKWLKSINTTSKESVRLGKKTCKYLNISEKKYRMILSHLRKEINVLEKQMSSKKWDEINFNSVPGGAMKKYTKAFYRHQEERFNTYLDALKNGKKITVNGKEVDAKINTKKLYPYEIIEKYTNNCGYCRSIILKPELEAMWGGLKDWLQGAENNNVVIADVSGSMYGRPMNTSVGLAIYFSEKNSGPFHNKFMTFSSNPTWISLNDNQTLAEKIGIVSKADWGGSTNIKAALDLILQVGLENNLSQEDMPKTLTIITDMEFDICTNGENKRMTFYDLMKDKYAKNGYQIPEIVFWNVNARNDTFHVNAFVKNVRMVSGQATSVFKTLIDGKTHTPYEFMLEVVYADRYDSVVTKKHY